MFNTGFSLDPLKDVPLDVQEKATELYLESNHQVFQREQSLKGEVEKLNRAYQTKLHKLIGRKNLERYLKFCQNQRETMKTAVSKQKPTFSGEQELQAVCRRAKAKSRRFLQDIRFDMTRASQMRNAHKQRLSQVIERHRGKPDDSNYLVLPKNVPENIYNPWAVYSPPYAGWAWMNSWWRTDEPDNPHFEIYLDVVTGSIGSKVHINVHGADDNDNCAALQKTGLNFWYQIPVTGLLEVWVKIQAIDTDYTGRFTDEWGWSDATCDQDSSIFLQVKSPAISAPRYSTVLDYRRTGTTAQWVNSVAAAGNERWAHLFSTESYAAGTWLLVEVGTQENNYFYSNDVTVRSTIKMHWFLKNVFIRSSGE